MKRKKIIFFVLVNGYIKVINMYFLMIKIKTKIINLTILYNFMKFI